MSDQTKSASSSLIRTVPTTEQHYFDHHRLDAFHVALEALVQGDAIARSLPRGYGTLADQLRRALPSANDRGSREKRG